MKPGNLKIIELTEYQSKSFERDEISQEFEIILHEKYKSLVGLDPPSYKTRYQWKVTAKG